MWMRGRRMGAPTTTRAAVIQEALVASGMSLTVLAARLGVARSTMRRWMNGQSRATTAFSLAALSEALRLDSAQRATFNARLGDYGTCVTDCDNTVCDAGRGVAGVAGEARAALAHLLREELRAKDVSARWLARALGVAPSTVTRLLEGSVARSRLRVDAVCDALELGEGSMRRRDVLKLALAGGLALTVAAPPALSARGLDYDDIARRLAEIEDTRAAGRLAEAWRAARAPDLRALIRRMRARWHDPKARAARFRYDFLLATMREHMTVWSPSANRPAGVIAWYEAAQYALLLGVGEREVGHELAQIHERIAPLQREMGAYDASIRSFDYALRQPTERAEDQALAVHLWRNRAHVWAVQGDERRWRGDLDCALAVIARMPAEMRDELTGLVIYSEGEGYKRLAEQPGLTPTERRQLMRRAYERLERSLTVTRTQWAAHEAVARLSMAQTLVWLNPHAALDLMERDEAAIRAAHAAHLTKLAITRARARRALA